MVDKTNKFISPIELTIQKLYDVWPNRDLSNVRKDATKLTKIIYRDYITPIHKWCIDNFSNDFCFWHSNDTISLLIIDPNDLTLWKLTWGDNLPTPKEAIDLKKS